LHSPKAGQLKLSGLFFWFSLEIGYSAARESADGVPGEEWFYEHVHLTFPGNYVVARQLAEQVVQCVSSADQKGDDGKSFLSLEECAQRLGADGL
jgi:hypothetical protein